MNAGAPSVLCAYGQEDMDRLAAASSAGAFMPLRFARFVAIAGLDQSWAVAMRAWIGRQRGPVSVSDAYRYFARHPKAAGNPNWRAKVRQKLAQVGERIERDRYVAAQPERKGTDNMTEQFEFIAPNGAYLQGTNELIPAAYAWFFWAGSC
jgi:hypothetical protein